MLTLLAAIDRNYAIGKNNALLYRVPEDMKNFRALTLGNVVICGRKTLESFPNGKPLPKRDTVLLSTTYSGEASPSLHVAHSVEEAVALAKECALDGKEIFVIGGEKVYRSFYPLCDRAILTEIDAETPDANAFFPKMNAKDGWKASEVGEWNISESGLSYRFVTWTK